MSFDNVGKMTDEAFDEVTQIMEAEDRGENPFNLIHRTKEEIARDAERAEIAQQVAAAVATPIKKGSKKEQAIAIYMELEDKSRKSIMDALQAAGFGKATSSTYAANLRSGVWS